MNWARPDEFERHRHLYGPETERRVAHGHQRSNIILQVEKIPSIGLKETVRMDLRIQKKLMAEVPEITRIVARVGSDELGLDPMSLNDTDTFMVLKPKDEWRMDTKEELIDAIRTVMEQQFPGINFAFTQPIQMRVDEMLTGARGDIAIKIFGESQGTLNQLADTLVERVKILPGAVDVYTPRNEGSRYLQLKVNRLMAGRLGLTVADVEELLRTQVEGLPAGIIYEGIRQTPLIIRGPETTKQSKSKCCNNPSAWPTGAPCC